MKSNIFNGRIKRTIFSFTILISATTILPGQTFKASIIAGFNLSQIDGDKLSGFNKLGLNTGLRVAADLSDRWSLSTEFLYSQQGASAVTSDDFTSPYGKIKLQFVEVPLMINFSDWKILASTGISYGRLAAFEVIDDQGDDVTAFEAYDENVFSIVFGATYFFNEKLGLNIRWSKYLNDLRADTGVNTTPFFGRNIGIRMYYKL